MADALSTAGVTLNYAVETVAGTYPTSGYTMIPQVKTIPSHDEEPSTHQTTPLEETEQHREIPALRAASGAMAHLANLNDEFFDAWEALCDAYEMGATSGMATWFVVIVPGLKRAWYFQAIPTRLAFAGAEVDTVLEINGYLTKSGRSFWADKPTDVTP